MPVHTLSLGSPFFSRQRVSSPAAAHTFAATEPPGPLPITITSHAFCSMASPNHESESQPFVTNKGGV